MGAKRVLIKKVKKTRSSCSSEDSSVDSDDEHRRTTSKRTAAAVSYKEESEDDKTDSEDLLEVEYAEPIEPVPEEKCETIEKIIAQRRGKKGGLY